MNARDQHTEVRPNSINPLIGAESGRLDETLTKVCEVIGFIVSVTEILDVHEKVKGVGFNHGWGLSLVLDTCAAALQFHIGKGEAQS